MEREKAQSRCVWGSGGEVEEAKAQVEREEEKTAKTTDSVFVNQNTRAEAREAGRS